MVICDQLNLGVWKTQHFQNQWAYFGRRSQTICNVHMYELDKSLEEVNTLKLGVFTSLFRGLSFEEMLDRVADAGLEAIELGTGGYPGAVHCNPDELLANGGKLKNYKQRIEEHGLIISALSCHGNPIHPDQRVAKQYHEVFEKTVLLAERLGVGVICLFSGCPGGSKDAKYPNWVTCTWPPEYKELLKWQWEEVLIPYWKKAANFAHDHGVRLAIEMHDGFMIYNPATLLQLHEVVGLEIGANLDPGNLFRQGIDPTVAIKYLGKKNLIFHFHAKDVYIDAQNTGLNGVLDTTSHGKIQERSWISRIPGYGHSKSKWKEMISALRMVGYDYVISIEYADPLISVNEGFERAVQFLRGCILTEPSAEMCFVERHTR